MHSPLLPTSGSNVGHPWRCPGHTQERRRARNHLQAHTVRDDAERAAMEHGTRVHLAAQLVRFTLWLANFQRAQRDAALALWGLDWALDNKQAA